MLSKLDLFPNTKDSVHVQTKTGGLVSLLSLLLALFLFYKATSEFMTIKTDNELVVNTDRDDQMQIGFNITFPNLPCAYMSLDIVDTAGNVQLDVNSTVYRQRLKERLAKPLPAEKLQLNSEIEPKEQRVVPQNSYQCNSCYGAESEDMKCCDTCNDIRQAYRKKGWSFANAKNMAQCINEGFIENQNAVKGEGCRVYGYVSVDKVGGNFHIAPGSSYIAGHGHLHDVSTFDYGESFDLSHTIHYLSFGNSNPGYFSPLNGLTKTTKADNSLFQYFLKVVDTSYTDIYGVTEEHMKFSVTHHYQPIDNSSTDHEKHGYPGVYFIYDLSPIEVNKVEKYVSFSRFFTQICSILGGVFTIFKIVDQVVYQGVRTYQKAQMGKAM